MAGAKESIRDWGLLPADVRKLVLKREWDNDAGLKARLLNRKPFPIRIGLKPPAGRNAIADMAHFQKFIGQWRSYSSQKTIQWESRRYRALAEQTVPKFFILENIKDTTYIQEELLSDSEHTDRIRAKNVSGKRGWSKHRTSFTLPQ